MKNYLLLSAAALTILALGCVQPPDYPIEPVIEYVGLTKNTMLQGKTGEDETYITISFTDGDGDIGFFQEGSSMVETDLFSVTFARIRRPPSSRSPLCPSWARPTGSRARSPSAC